MPRLTHTRIADVEPVGPVAVVNAATAAVPTRWLRVKRLQPITITVEGSGSFTVRLYGSNNPTTPATGATHYPALTAADVTAKTLLTFDALALEHLGVEVVSVTGSVTVCVAAG